ncbi:MAG: type II toxin-antitoxin system ParD family antitoxin [Acidobacteria bacterium]|nr:type II toxin-antitoxin system ParD family antitoxin [Acidobacteriota bacterium]MBP9110937.1 type II toxin-antitoxin system ParD family antitoxin [Pyrinomonadaceae bacterium]
MATTTMNISLPDSMRVFVEDTLNDDGYGSASEYVRELIRADQKRRNEKRLETVLLERLRSGDDVTFTMDDVRAEMRRRIEAKK